MSGIGVGELLKHRLAKRGLYDTARYWDLKARRYRGLARSNWPSNLYNHEMHVRQMRLVDALLGDVRDKAILEVGCGTGRVSLELARRGAAVRGWDFSEAALQIARSDARRESLIAEFVRTDLLGDVPLTGARFDVVLSIGCLAVACADVAALSRAVLRIAVLTRPGGRVLFIEPIHRSRALGRILRLDIEAWTECCTDAGLVTLASGRMLFAPARMALAFIELPKSLVQRVFAAGENLLPLLPRAEWLADYKWLFFERSAEVETHARVRS